MKYEHCFGCMEPVTEVPCPHCGYDPRTPDPDFALRRGTILNGKYLVGRVLGQGGFGITYIGMDLVLERKVAIKEYFPTGKVGRNGSTTALTWYATALAADAQGAGMESFLKEARKMTKVSSIPGVVQVLDLFQSNNTAYIIMDYIEGETLKSRLKKTGPLSWEDAKKIFLPAIETMAQVHQAGLIHRDLSPDNLMLQSDGSVKILDLGASKDTKSNSGVSSMQVAKGGFSPLEQYTQRGASAPATDVYAMAATIYYSLTGILPPSAIDRMDKDTLDWTLPRLQVLSKGAIATLQKAMALRSEDRVQTMQELADGLTRNGKIPMPPKPPKPPKPISKKWIIAGAAAAVALVCIVVAISAGSRKPAESNNMLSGASSPAGTLTRPSNPGKPIDFSNAIPSDAYALLAKGTEDVYDYQNGYRMELYFNSQDQEVCRALVSPKGERELLLVATYDDAGNMIEERGYEGTQLMMIKFWTYNADGKVLSFKLYTDGGTLQYQTETTYDSKGRESAWSKWDGSGDLLGSSTTSYDASGEGTQTGSYGNGETFRYRYDADGNCLEYLYSDPNGKQQYRGVNEYDASGREIAWLYYDRNDKLSSREEYTYTGDRKTGKTYYSYYNGKESITNYTMLYGPHDTAVGEKEIDGTSESYSEYFHTINGSSLRSFYFHTGDWYSDQLSYYNWDGNYLGYGSFYESGALECYSVHEHDVYGNSTSSTATYYKEDGSLDYTSESYYDSLGNYTGNDSFYPDGTLESTSRYTFDDAGNKTGYESKRYTETGSLSYESMDRYDPDTGNTVSGEFFLYNDDGSLSSKSVYHYDSEGNKTGRTWTYYRYDGSYSVTEYDSDDNEISEKTYDAQGKLISSK